MERIAILIGRCTIYEQLYLDSNDIPDIVEKALESLRGALVALYTAILQAISQLLAVFQGKIAVRPYTYIDERATNESVGKSNILRPPEATLAELTAIEAPESVVNFAASAVDKCCEKKPDPNP